ncbi:MAG: reverse transcriptase domain-containing protein [Patescibacteria group bacterium]|nr:reverse transcriptase domain-containing protein [Patescibacteria group bacterium]
MKIYKDLYWSIISPQTLFYAWEVFKSDKRNKPDIIEFELNLEQNIFNLYRDLKNEMYKHGPYRGFWIHDPKLRRIHKATVRDRVFHHAIFCVLYKIFEPTFINDSYSCRIGKGTHKGMKKVADMIRVVSKNHMHQCFALKCDVRKFFDSVNQDILITIIERKIKDEKVRFLIREIISSYFTTYEREREREYFCYPKRYTNW